jgi:hypothetical protein
MGLRRLSLKIVGFLGAINSGNRWCCATVVLFVHATDAPQRTQSWRFLRVFTYNQRLCDSLNKWMA